MAISLSSQPIKVIEPDLKASFPPLISDVSLSLGVDGEKGRLRYSDTGLVDLFMLQSVLPFSPASDSGQSVLVH